MDRKIKLNVLRQLAMTMGDQMTIPLLSFLAGRLDHVHFVDDLEGANVAVTLLPGTRLWPRTPFRAELDRTPVNHPVAFIERMALRDDDIFIRVEFGALEVPPWYQEALVEEPMSLQEQLEESVDHIRDKIDLALDAYRTANESLQDASEEKRKYLRFVLDEAKSEMRALNTRLTELEMELNAESQ